MEAPEKIPSPTIVEQTDKGIEHQVDFVDKSIIDHGWNIFKCDNILKKIRKIGNEDDLYQLRQVDVTFYEMLGSTFFDEIFPRIELEDEDMNLKAKSMQWVKNEQKDVMDIPLNKLTDYKHIFRCLYFSSFDSEYTLPMIEICAPFQSYITMLGMPFLRFPDLDNWTLLKFINQFAALGLLELYDFTSKDLPTYTLMRIPLDELEKVLNSIRSKPKISLNISIPAFHAEILAKFGTRPNTTIHLSKQNPQPTSYSDALDCFQNISTLLNQFQNADLDCSWIRNFSEDFDDAGAPEESSIDNILRLQILTNLWTQYGKEEDLLLCLNLSSLTNFPDTNEVMECLVKLSPFVTDLRLLQWVTPADLRDILSMDCEWPKLSRLRIDGYKHPLEILKKCPNLKVLEIVEMVQQSCIFFNKDQSYKKNLQDCFGNLLELERLEIKGKLEPYWYNPEENIIKFNGLDSYLKGLFPKIKKYTNSKRSNLFRTRRSKSV